MDEYYRKLMGNGTVASKFRLDSKTTTDKCSRSGPLPVSEAPNTVAGPASTDASSSHHNSNCVRCYKLKKKCSRQYPLCDYCLRSGTACEYVERRRKRQKLEEPLWPGEKPKTVSISSLLHRDETEEFRNIDVTSINPSPSLPRSPMSGVSPCASIRGKLYLSLHRKLVSLAVSSRSKTKLLDELLVVKAIDDLALPSSFMHTFIANYEWKYPFLPLSRLLLRFKTLSFRNETLVNLDIYLAMAIGCIIHDSNHNTKHFEAYFSDSLIESIVDIVNYDFQPQEDSEAINVLTLLSIYSINVCNTTLIWSILGFLNRFILYITDFTDVSKKKLRKRSFWTIFNLDKELSLMVNKPSQFIPTQIILENTDFTDVLEEGELVHLATLMGSAVELHRLQDRMLAFSLGLVEADEAARTQYSSDLEVWRVSVLLLIHTEYEDLLLLQNFIGLVNLDYYYLLIKLDQLLSTELFQFTLQFLSNSFSLLLSEQSEKKGVVGTSMHSLFWYLKFFRVVECKLTSLVRVLKSGISKTDLNSRLNDFNSNVQLIINLINFLLNKGAGPKRFVSQLRAYTAHLTKINGLLMSFNPLTALEEHRERLLANVESTVIDVRSQEHLR